MRIKKKQKKNIWSDEKQLKKVALLLYENYDVTEDELKECKQIIENLRKHSQGSSVDHIESQ